MEYIAESVDVAVIGGGHAGIEAALAAARLGARTVLFSMSLDAIANLPCNPSIGGTAKGHLVREIDALGGEMGRAADAVLIQSRMLNRGKGPAVHSLRAQVDRSGYHFYMKRVLENQDRLTVKQAEIVELRLDNRGEAAFVETDLGAVYPVRAVVLCTGTYLRGRIYVGEYSANSGPDGMHAATRLSESLTQLGISLRRFKTGTPARVDRRSIDFDQLEIQEGDQRIIPFSFETQRRLENKVVCHIAYTNQDTHQVIRDNLHRSPLYGGRIEGVGPRYCPSIEDKVVRFSEKPRHQLFIEPMGLHTNEMYLQGMSSSLPEDVQIRFYRTIQGMENLQIMRNAYAIEYDCIDPVLLSATLEFKAVGGLFGAGQINGTSGYEEAAAQGLVAGINAAHRVLRKEPLVLKRSSSYIGTLIDDLVTKGCQDPYRMMTSRSEYRLLLRQDNADVRLTPTGYQLGLISEKRWKMFHVKQQQVERERKRIESINLPPGEALNQVLRDLGTSEIETGASMVDLIRRPQVSHASMQPFDPDRPSLPLDVAEQVEIGIKYEGYIKKQLAQVKQTALLEEIKLPRDLDYFLVKGLRLEAREKLDRVRPRNLGQASRISGVSPADISVLQIVLEQRRREGKDFGTA